MVKAGRIIVDIRVPFEKPFPDLSAEKIRWGKGTLPLAALIQR